MEEKESRVDTVQLNGKYYTSHCSEGQEVKAGDLLMEFDMKAIKEAGFKTITPVIVTNTDDFADIKVEHEGEILVGETLLDITK